ncbi:MAG TPA: LysR family transcriptional regulator [Acidimicrobiales bacterium]|nr:LysR family transcriptional regulator [Acidimicrobiales bacterium]
MDLRQLTALIAVADNGTFSAAADALHTVQSNVSSHVARLEKELGAQLVDRQGGELTAEGEAVVERARRIAGELEALITDVAALRAEVVGSVRLGMIGTTARWLVPRLLERLAEQHPKVRLVVVDSGSATLEPQLISGRLDLAVVTLPVPDPDLTSRRLFDEDLMLVVAFDHPLAERDELTMADLDHLPLLLPARGTAFRDEIERAATKAGVTLTPKAELDGVRLIASLTFDGHGPAILPATAVPDRLAAGWKRIAVAGMPRRQVGVASRRRGQPSAPARALLAVIDEIIATDVPTHNGLHPLEEARGANPSP